MNDKNRKTLGQIVDDLADQYFASGVDPITAGVRACLDMARMQVEACGAASAFVEQLLSRMEGARQ